MVKTSVVSPFVKKNSWERIDQIRAVDIFDLCRYLRTSLLGRWWWKYKMMGQLKTERNEFNTARN